MWCPSCRADVAAELSLDNRRLLCARCQTELGLAAGMIPAAGTSTRNHETERDARDLLARWSAQTLLDQPNRSGAAAAAVRDGSSPEAPASKPELRFDRTMSSPPAPSAAMMNAWKQPSATLPLERPEPVTGHLESSESKEQSPAETTEQVKQIEVQTNAVEPAASEHSNFPPAPQDYAHPQIRIHPHWTAILGQLAAYSGAALLSCGSALGMWSYFGGPANYLATGWLAAAIGQLMLMLGVVTLISNGLDQTVKEVSWRIDHLAEEVHHMGLALDALEHAHHTTTIELSRSQRDKSDQSSTREAA